MDATEFTPIEGTNIILSCITPEARDLLDRIMSAWVEHETGMTEYAKQRGVHYGEISHYGFAYWLVRYSGLIEPSKQDAL